MAAATSGWAGGDGLQYGANVVQFNYAKPLAKVIDIVLNSTTYASRALFNAENFDVATLLKTTKVTRRTQGQWITGLEPLNSADEIVTIQQQSNRTLYSMPKVNILSEAFAREYDKAIDYDDFQYEDIVDEVVQDLSLAIVSGTGVGNQPNSLDMICDDGTTYGTINGVTRSTYTAMKGTNTNWSAAGNLSKLATLYDAISDSGPSETPTVLLVNFTGFSLFESLYTPTVRHEYSTLPMGGRFPKAEEADKMGQGFSSLSWRGIPIIRDKAVASGVGYMLNERYLCWYGDTKAPKAWDGVLENVKLGTEEKEGQSADERPSRFHGFFYQDERPMPSQAGLIGRLYLSGQHVSWQPRRQGRFYNFTAIG